MKRCILLTLTILLALPLFAGTGRIRKAANPIKDEYLVLLRDDIPMSELSSRAAILANRYTGSVRRVMQGTANGFSVNMTEKQAERLAAEAEVLLVEENGYVEISLTQPLPSNDELYNLDRIDQRDAIASGDDQYKYCSLATDVHVYVVDTGILRTHVEFESQVTPGLSRVVDGVCFADDCVYPSPGNDKGTLPCGGPPSPSLNGGHGTSVASIAAGKTVGVAKNATLVPVRVLNCNAAGTYEHLNFGLDWIRSPSNPYRYYGAQQRLAVVNMSTYRRTTTTHCTSRIAEGESGSLCNDSVDNDCDGLMDGADLQCGGVCTTLNDLGCQAAAIEHVINRLVLDGTTPDGKVWKGIPIIVSANNQGTQWNNTTPARLAYSNAAYHPSTGRVISVGGVTAGDVRWQCPTYTGELCLPEALNDGTPVNYGSNFGPTVDIWAPSHNIKSAHILSNDAYRTLAQSKSGTSFAAPLVTGVVALMRETNPSWSPDTLWQQLQTNATQTSQAIDPVTGNNKIVYRHGCLP
ncbi:MAG: S8 family serine peptidase [Thermoanaerobaculia bacterium]|nr:S8 family serine peptidase [Thermoanaerobaculia bacterium]